MSAHGIAPARLFTAIALVLGLTFTMFSFSTIGPNTSGASALVTATKGNLAADWARSRKGSRYQYGATGPHRFDCSGLTRWAYARIGKSLPHSSSAQYASTRHVAISDLQPGDLVFYYSPISHVGIYIGGGRIIHAPHPGQSVEIASLHMMPLVGAARP